MSTPVLYEGMTDLERRRAADLIDAQRTPISPSPSRAPISRSVIVVSTTNPEPEYMG